MTKDRTDQDRIGSEPRRSAAGEARDARRRERLARAMRENLRRRKAREGQLEASPGDGGPQAPSSR